MTRNIAILTPENVEVNFELAGIGSRFMAVLVDTLLQSLTLIVLFLLVIIAMAFDMMSVIDSSPSWLLAILILLLFVVTNGYFLYFEAAKNGQTPGKKMVGIRVIRDTGHPVDFRWALLRNLMRIVDQIPGSYGIGFITMFFSRDYRRLGDFVAGTIVVKVSIPARPVRSSVTSRSVQSSPTTGGITTEGQGLPQESLVYLSLVSKDDYRAIRHYLDRRIGLDISVARSLAMRLAKPLAEKLHVDIAAVDDPVVFLENVCREWEQRMVH